MPAGSLQITMPAGWRIRKRVLRVLQQIVHHLAQIAASPYDPRQVLGELELDARAERLVEREHFAHQRVQVAARASRAQACARTG